MAIDDQTKLVVWNKGIPILHKDAQLYRSDRDGKEIHWREYGNRDSNFGWEIHHVTPVSCGGTDDLSNLIPLHWETNASLGGKLSSN